jgi:hypothetical protein
MNRIALASINETTIGLVHRVVRIGQVELGEPLPDLLAGQHGVGHALGLHRGDVLRCRDGYRSVWTWSLGPLVGLCTKEQERTLSTSVPDLGPNTKAPVLWTSSTPDSSSTAFHAVYMWGASVV